MTQPTPSPQEVNRFHTKSDVDSSRTAQHHTIGLGANQVSSGQHNHDGNNSKLILEGKDTSFPATAPSSYSQAFMQRVVNLLREMGAGR